MLTGTHRSYGYRERGDNCLVGFKLCAYEVLNVASQPFLLYAGTYFPVRVLTAKDLMAPERHPLITADMARPEKRRWVGDLVGGARPLGFSPVS